MKKQAKKTNGSEALARVAQPRPEESAIVRMARDKSITVEKLERLLAMQERADDRAAARDFELAFQQMLPKIPRIRKGGRIEVDGNVRARYAKYEDIRAVVDPIMSEYGFSFATRTEWPAPGLIEVVGMLSHRHGHKRESRFQTTADTSGKKSAIQGLGSGVQYGRRYTLKDLLAIVEEGIDDDGRAHGRADRRSAPAVVDAKAGDPITDAQRKRLFTILQRVHRPEQELRDWLKRRFSITSTKDIPRSLYDSICAAVEAPGLLPDREPGDE